MHDLVSLLQVVGHVRFLLGLQVGRSARRVESRPHGTLQGDAGATALRIGIDLPWGYDDYYHLGLARELGRDFPLRAFPWTPFSVLAERYADKELLFHILLIPISGLPLNNFSLDLVDEIYQSYERLLKADGTLTSFEYVWIRHLKMPFAKGAERDRLVKLTDYLEGKFRRYQIDEEVVLINVPPAVARHMRFT